MVEAFEDPLFHPRTATLRNLSGDYTEHGEWDPTETEHTITVIGEPQGEMRLTEPSGARMAERVIFFTPDLDNVSAVVPNLSVIEADGVTYRVTELKRWRTYTSIMAVREEGQ